MAKQPKPNRESDERNERANSVEHELVTAGQIRDLAGCSGERGECFGRRDFFWPTHIGCVVIVHSLRQEL